MFPFLTNTKILIILNKEAVIENMINEISLY